MSWWFQGKGERNRRKKEKKTKTFSCFHLREENNRKTLWTNCHELPNKSFTIVLCNLWNWKHRQSYDQFFILFSRLLLLLILLSYHARPFFPIKKAPESNIDFHPNAQNFFASFSSRQNWCACVKEDDDVYFVSPQ